MPVEELERDIYATGFFRQKTKAIRGTMRVLLEEFDGVVPREYWGVFPHLLIWHGRRVCIARRPLCEQCVLADLCPSSRLEIDQVVANP